LNFTRLIDSFLYLQTFQAALSSLMKHLSKWKDCQILNASDLFHAIAAQVCRDDFLLLYMRLYVKF
jgi:hypothetical protein